MQVYESYLRDNRHLNAKTVESQKLLRVNKTLQKFKVEESDDLKQVNFIADILKRKKSQQLSSKEILNQLDEKVNEQMYKSNYEKIYGMGVLNINKDKLA